MLRLLIVSHVMIKDIICKINKWFIRLTLNAVMTSVLSFVGENCPDIRWPFSEPQNQSKGKEKERRQLLSV